jgi:DNA polymerase-3 subunit delta'
MADKRIVIIDAADDLERGGANALLKSLEEPPQGTYFLLISHMSDRLLPTIRSRCQMLRFDPLSDNDMTSALNILLPDAGSNEIAALVRTGRGAPGEAIQLSGIGFDAIEQLAEDILTKGDSSNQIRMQIAEKLSVKAAQSSYEAFLRYVPGRIARAASDLPVSVWHTVSGTNTYLLKDYRVNPGETKEVTVGNKVVLQTGDVLKAITVFDNAFDIYVSVLEDLP